MDANIRKLEIEILQTEHLQHKVFNAFVDIEPALLKIQKKGVKCCWEQKILMSCLSYTIASLHLTKAQNLLEEMKIKVDDNDNS